MKIAFYHNNCCDGLFGAYAAWKKFRGNILLIPIDYSRLEKQDIFEFVDYYLVQNFFKNKRFSYFAYELIDLSSNMSNIDVYFIDIAPDLKKFQDLLLMFKSVTILDHHKTAKDRYLEAYPECVVENGKITELVFKNSNIKFANEMCGSMLAEEFFFGQVKPYNELVNDYDMWIKAMPDSDAFVAGAMALNPKTIKNLDDILNEGIHKVIEIGEVIQNTRERRSDSCCSRAVPIDLIHGDQTYKAALVNSELDLSSILCNKLVTKFNYDVAVAYSIKTNNEVGFSVRSAEHIDSTFLSTSHGGGGHRCASGFASTLEELVKVLNSKRWVVEK